MAFEHLAKEHPRVAFAHVYPGLVLGPGFNDTSLPAWLRLMLFVGWPLMYLLSTSAEDAGYLMLLPATDVCPARENAKANQNDKQYFSTDGIKGGGAYTVGRKGEELKGKTERAELRSAGLEEQVWQHTMKAFKDIVENGKFPE